VRIDVVCDVTQSIQDDTMCACEGDQIRRETPTDRPVGDQWGPGKANLVGDLTSLEKRQREGSPTSS